MGKLVPRTKPKAYILSDKVAFVPHPDFRAMWLRVHPAIVLVDCPDCGSKKGVPCNQRGNYGVFSHHRRRHKAGEDALQCLDHVTVKYNYPPTIKEKR